MSKKVQKKEKANQINSASTSSPEKPLKYTHREVSIQTVVESKNYVSP